GLGAVQDIRVRGHDPGGDVVDVRARVAVLRRVQAPGRGGQGPAEAVDLRTVVIEVVLAGHLGAGRLEDPAQRVADRRPAGTPQVDGPRGVGRDELEVDPSAGHRLAGAERLALVDHGRDQCALRAGVEPDVEETGAGDLGGTHARILGEDGRDLL